MNPGIGDLIYNSSVNLLDKNISSYHQTIKSKGNFAEDSVRINHLYIKEKLSFNNLEEYRYMMVSYTSDIQLENNEYLLEEEKKKRYNKEEDEIFCGRFPHLFYCGCKYPCSITLQRISPIEIIDNIFCGSIECAYKTKELLHLKISYVLNVSCMAYKKRMKYFKYLDIFIYDNHTENAIKFFKITNRFIDDAIKNNCKILIHSEQGRSRCWVFFMAYLIGKQGMKYVSAYDTVREKFAYAEPNDNFLTQLKHYDLEVNTS